MTAPPQALPAALATFGAAHPLVANAAPLEALGADGTPLNSYMKIWLPLVDGALGGNPTLVHWLHPVNMGVVSPSLPQAAFFTLPCTLCVESNHDGVLLSFVLA